MPGGDRNRSRFVCAATALATVYCVAFYWSVGALAQGVPPPGYGDPEMPPHLSVGPESVPPGRVAPPRRAGDAPPPAMSPEVLPPPGIPEGSPDQMVVDVRVEGNKSVSLQKVTRYIRTRAGRPLNLDVVEEDVRRLTRTRLFVSVETSYLHAPAGGLVVLFRVVERPTLQYVKYIGNTIRKRNLEKQTGLKKGDALDPYAVEEGRRKLEEFYLSKGYSKAKVSVIEGTRQGDRGAIYLISEGRKQKVFRTQFVGNEIASDARLRTQIQSKPPLLYLFKGEVDRQKIEEDVERLTAYYRSLGFFRARIGRELEFNAKQNWLTLTFVIEEGPRYVVRNVSFIGNTKFNNDQLFEGLKLHSDQYFNQAAMTKDVSTIQDLYGARGYVFAAVQADPRFLEEAGQLDLVYQIAEGARYRVGRIDVQIQGENPHTRRNTVLNRISLRPGDIVDIRQLRASERRLRASGLFLVDPAQGIQPKIVFRQPELEGEEESYVERPGAPGKFRGQSPEVATGVGRDRQVVLSVMGRLAGQAHGSVEPKQANGRPHFRRAEVPTFRAQSPDAGQVPLGRTGPDSGSWSGGATAGSPALGGQNPVQRVQYAPPIGQDPRGASVSPAPPGSRPYATYSQPRSSSPFDPAPEAFGPPPAVNPDGYDDSAELFGPDTPFMDGEPPPQNLDLVPVVSETQTGRLMLGVGINSNAGLVGNVVIDEQNFDWRRFPRSWEEVRNATAFRGAGQQLRIEAVPGNQVSRYMFTFREPYWRDTLVSLGLNGFFFTRRYRDWDEERLGGRVSLGYQFTPDLSGTFALRGENVEISNPRLPMPPELASVVGDNSLYSGRFSLVHDTRDSTFLATEGHLVEVAFEQAFGDFDYPRGTIEARKFFMMHERPDGSGRHVLSVGSELGISGTHTPIFENFFAGGFTTLRGFRFREASPRNLNVLVGGRFQWINSVEYMFPITADDALRGVLFCDFGTVERDVELHADSFRVAPGFGMRISVPALGPAPIALDFAFPVARDPLDDIQVFSFFVGFNR